MSANETRTIGGKPYSAMLLEQVEADTARTEQPIDLEGAQRLLEAIRTQGEYTSRDKRTIRWLRTHRGFSDEADALFRREIRRWSAQRAAHDSAAYREDSPSGVGTARETTSYYKVINGRRYKNRLLQIADLAVAGHDEGLIGLEDAKRLIACVRESPTYTEVERDTMAFIWQNYRFTRDGAQELREELVDWQLEVATRTGAEHLLDEEDEDGLPSDGPDLLVLTDVVDEGDWPRAAAESDTPFLPPLEEPEVETPPLQAKPVRHADATPQEPTAPQEPPTPPEASGDEVPPLPPLPETPPAGRTPASADAEWDVPRYDRRPKLDGEPGRKRAPSPLRMGWGPLASAAVAVLVLISGAVWWFYEPPLQPVVAERLAALDELTPDEAATPPAPVPPPAPVASSAEAASGEAAATPSSSGSTTETPEAMAPKAADASPPSATPAATKATPAAPPQPAPKAAIAAAAKPPVTAAPKRQPKTAATPAVARTLTPPPPAAPKVTDAEPAVPPEVSVYEVKPGDTLWDISGAMLHDPHRWPELVRRADPELGNPDRLLPGTLVRLPQVPPPGALKLWRGNREVQEGYFHAFWRYVRRGYEDYPAYLEAARRWDRTLPVQAQP